MTGGPLAAPVATEFAAGVLRRRGVYKLKYDFASIEKKWQDIWEAQGTFAASNDYTKPKYYALVEFPYPSGQGLHVGHPRSYTALDIVARKRRFEGYNVLYPMGWDAFGLPTENYAIKNHIHPEKVTHDNVQRFKAQLKSLGLSFDCRARSTRPTRPIISGRNGFSSSSLNAGWRIKRRCRSTGVPAARSSWQTRRS